MKAQKVLQGFFWIAFAAFLLASIPHVSYFFRAFEPNDPTLDWWYWSVSTFIAVSIDVTVFLLSMTVAGLQRQNKPKSLVFSVWLFIISLSFLSWYMNNRYAVHFANNSMLSQTPITVPLVNIVIPDINPLIASCFQALAIAYTWISDKIAFSESPKTAAQLQQEADELEAATKQKRRIAAINRESNVGGITALFDAGKTIASHIKNGVKQSPDPAFEAAWPDILVNDQVNNEGGNPLNEQVNSQVNEDVYQREEEINQSPNERASTPVYQSPRITDKLAEQSGEQLPNTGPVTQVNKVVRKSKASGDTPAKRIQRLLEKNPELGPTELAARVGCSKGYASQIKTKFQPVSQ